MLLRALGCAAAVACCLTVARPAVAGCGTCDKTVVENAANNADFSTLVAAVKAAGLAETLSGNGPFTVFAWIKGGGPGQVIMSQRPGENWLMVDDDGKLITELKDTGRSPTSLHSETVITDGNWHRIGFVWDGAQRNLYVDDTHVAMDLQAGLVGSTGGLAIGVGKGNQAGTFWSGMIDDVRIYNRAIMP